MRRARPSLSRLKAALLDGRLPVVSLGLIVLAVLAGALLDARAAEAHANLVSSRPADSEVLTRSPQRVEITFSEEVGPAQSYIHVLDVSGNRVDLDDLHAADGDPLTLRAGLPELDEGAYTVAWSNLSTVDGHTITGSFVFFVGSAAFPTLETDQTTEGQGGVRGEPLTRWPVLIGLVLLAGVPWIFGLVLAGTTTTEESRSLRRPVERVALAGGLLVLIAGAVQLALKMDETTSGLSLIPDTRWGNGWALRTVLAALATAGYALGSRRLPGRARQLLPVTAIAAALAVSLTSHGAAAEDFGLVAGLVDAVHILATVAWGGGLVAFLLLARRARTDRHQSEVLRAAIPRFAVLGGLSTVTLAMTGTYAAWLHVGSLDAIGTTYGRGVVLKVFLLIALVAIAAVNTTWVRRRVIHPRDIARGSTWLRRLLTAEVALIAVVLLASATITSLEPARQQRAAEERAAGVVTVTEDAGLTIRSSITPGEVGPNGVRVELSRNGEPYEDATDIQLRYVNMEAVLSASTIPLEPRADGAWVLSQPAIMSVDGIYELALRVQWPEGLDARQNVQFETGADRASGGLNPSRAWWFGILALTVVGAAMIAANALASRRRVMRGELLGWAGAALAAGALLLWARIPETPALGGNPIPATSSSLMEGAEVYATHCATCHGAEFDGQGEHAMGLPAAPANLVLHFPQHSDGQHFAVIENGREASGMPAWEGVLTDEEMWHVINYLRAETEARAPTRGDP